MRIINIIENTAGKNDCIPEHGLCFYVETKKHKILVDTGASGLLVENANQLGIDLSEVDTVVITHGHYDHGGGILSFADLNDTATIYINEHAFQKFYSTSRGRRPRYIGLSRKVKDLPQLEILEDGVTKIDDELTIFSDIGDRYENPQTNSTLFIKDGGELVEDDFRHEQCLVVSCEGKKILFSGCAHHDIQNIMDKYLSIFKSDPTAVISGFHTQRDGGYSNEDIMELRDIAKDLVKFRTVFYTCHCTGVEPFEELKKLMKNRIQYVHCGDEVRIPKLKSERENDIKDDFDNDIDRDDDMSSSRTKVTRASRRKLSHDEEDMDDIDHDDEPVSSRSKVTRASRRKLSRDEEDMDDIDHDDEPVSSRTKVTRASRRKLSRDEEDMDDDDDHEDDEPISTRSRITRAIKRKLNLGDEEDMDDDDDHDDDEPVSPRSKVARSSRRKLSRDEDDMDDDIDHDDDEPVSPRSKVTRSSRRKLSRDEDDMDDDNDHDDDEPVSPRSKVTRASRRKLSRDEEDMDMDDDIDHDDDEPVSPRSKVTRSSRRKLARDEEDMDDDIDHDEDDDMMSSRSKTARSSRRKDEPEARPRERATSRAKEAVEARPREKVVSRAKEAVVSKPKESPASKSKDAAVTKLKETVTSKMKDTTPEEPKDTAPAMNDGKVIVRAEDTVRAKYRKITETLIKRNLSFTAMESCTSGLIASFISDTEGASAVMKGSYITYSNEAKILHGVPKETIDKYGVYSYETAEDMAFSAGAIYEADVSVGVTGTMGNPDPANDDSVPGEVYFAIASKYGNKSYHANIPPKHSRYEYKLAVAELVADKLMEILGK
ncbi:nicotinamide-nucleotide amidohydrolase family protein [Butyrivibrio sp. LB2008]|uniref:nicotinamide-nucleotide amidohydrolase family protein n=1 Tax=Butyrivibrio sp. LB2008 TaxID=1408305 RepID=UPI000686ABAE|nr:nicotinamide-nucleotide amidohydrolase family protein [Butyrivibrio sp. LB2008]